MHKVVPMVGYCSSICSRTLRKRSGVKVEGRPHADHDRRGRQHEQQQERRRTTAAQERHLGRRAGTEPAREGGQEIGQERGRGECGQADRLEATASGDGRQQGRDERHRHANARRGHEIEHEIAPERALRR